MNDRIGAAGEAGAPGEPGTPGRGGRGGHGGHGGAAARGPLFGYLAASVVMAALIYFLLFSVRGDLVASCDRVNFLRMEFNARAKPITETITLLIDARQQSGSIGQQQGRDGVLDAEIRKLRHYRAETGTVPLVDCPAAFQRPWPFE